MLEGAAMGWVLERRAACRLKSPMFLAAAAFSAAISAISSAVGFGLRAFGLGLGLATVGWLSPLA